MSRRKIATEDDIRRAIIRNGSCGYGINPLAYRSRGRVKLLERMRSNGELVMKVHSPGYITYHFAEKKP